MVELLAQGKLRAIAYTGAARSPIVPNVPTVAESGLPGYEITNWLGIVAPARVDPGIVAALNRAVVRMLQSEGVKRDLAARGMEAVGSSPEDFARHIRAELAKWKPIVRDCIDADADHA